MEAVFTEDLAALSELDELIEQENEQKDAFESVPDDEEGDPEAMTDAVGHTEEETVTTTNNGVTAPKKRGRKPLSAEEKAARAALKSKPGAKARVKAEAGETPEKSKPGPKPKAVVAPVSAKPTAEGDMSIGQIQNFVSQIAKSNIGVRVQVGNSVYPIANVSLSMGREGTLVAVLIAENKRD